MCLYTQLFNLFIDCGQMIQRPCMQDHIASTLRQRHYNRAADAATRACHQCPFAVESFHLSSSKIFIALEMAQHSNNLMGHTREGRHPVKQFSTEFPFSRE
jgi:hypothetical protein